MEKIRRPMSKSSMNQANSAGVRAQPTDMSRGKDSKSMQKRTSFKMNPNQLTSSQCVEEIKNAFKTMGNQSHDNIEMIEQSPSPKDPNDKSDNEIEVDEQDSPATKEKAKKKSNQKLILCTSATRYNVIKRVCRRMEFKLNEDENADWDLFWSDVGI